MPKRCTRGDDLTLQRLIALVLYRLTVVIH